MKRITLFLVFTIGIMLCSCEKEKVKVKVEKEEIIVSRVEWRGKQLTFTNKVDDSHHWYKRPIVFLDSKEEMIYRRFKDKKICLYVNVPEIIYDIKKYDGIELFITFYNITDEVQKYYYGKWITNKQYIGPLYGIVFDPYFSDGDLLLIMLSQRQLESFYLPNHFAMRKYLNENDNMDDEDRFQLIRYSLKYYEDGFLVLNPGEHQTRLVRMAGDFLGDIQYTNGYMKYQFKLISDYSKYKMKYSGNALDGYLQGLSTTNEYYITSDSEIIFINMYI